MKENKINIILIIIWLVITVFVACQHEFWRDETQAWCLVRDCNIIEMLNLIRIEGHLPLWYFLLFPFAKLGFSPAVMQIISVFSVGFGVFLLLFKSQFSIFQKIITVFSAGFLYYLPVIARNYSLIPAILFSIALLYEKRNTHPILYSVLIILLSLTHPYMIGISGILGLFFIIENYKSSKIPCLYIILNFVLLFFWFISALGGNTASETKYKQIIPLSELIIFISKVYLFDIINNIKPLIKYAALISFLGFIPAVLFALVGFFRENKKIFLFVFTGISFILAAFSIVFFNGILYQKLFLVVLLLIFGTMLLKNKIITFSINALLIISCLTSFFVIKDEINYNFSGSKQAADFIKKNYINEKVIAVMGNPYLYSSISAYLPDIKFYSPYLKDYISYVSYRPIFKNILLPDNTKLFIVDESIVPEEYGLKTIFETDKKILSSRTEREVFKICIKE